MRRLRSSRRCCPNSLGLLIFLSDFGSVELFKEVFQRARPCYFLKGVRVAYKKEEVICVFQPHRISRLKDLRKEFSFSFQDANTVVLCPIYTAGEKIKLGFNYLNFAKELIKNSKVKLFLVDDKYQLAKYIKNNIYGKKIVIGMGAGSISAWMRELPKLL